MSEDLYLVPKLKEFCCHRSELIVKKSRFIASVFHTPSVDVAKQSIDLVCKEFADARHNCFAYNVTKPGSTAFCGCSDDGEPHGTAGRPMLNVLIHSEVGEICVVVTRYFGGILLGTGGLVKAYQDSVKQALETLPSAPKMILTTVNLQIDHRYVTVLLRLLQSMQGEIIASSFAEKAHYQIGLPASEVENLKRQLMELTKGQLEFKVQ